MKHPWQGSKFLGQTAFRILGGVIFVALLAGAYPSEKATAAPPCPQPGWFPEGIYLKDHSLFWADGYYYIVSINHPVEEWFLYGRSPDLCHWEQLDSILPTSHPDTGDEIAIWAPFVFEENGQYFLYYAAMGSGFTQRIFLATSTNPADPTSWKRRGVVFEPDHPGMVWSDNLDGEFANCRDPFLLKVGAVYYLAYTGSDEAGGIVGLARSSSPYGPWTEDIGAIVEPQPGAMLESPVLVRRGSTFYLFYNRREEGNSGEKYRFSSRIVNFNDSASQEYSFSPGWAHEIWQDQTGDWYASYLVDYSITIAPLTWDTFFKPARPFLASQVYHRLFPLIFSSLNSAPNLPSLPIK